MINLLMVLMDIVQGLEYLHSRGIVHGGVCVCVCVCVRVRVAPMCVCAHVAEAGSPEA